MPNILITGAASGLGLAFLLSYAQQLSHSDSRASVIYAVDRRSGSDTLKAIEQACRDEALVEWMHGHVVTLKVDITRAEDITYLSEAIAERGGELHLVIHSAGMRGLVDDGRGVQKYEDVRGSESWEVMNAETMRKAFDVNVIGAFEVLKCCVPSLKKAAMAGTRHEQNGDYGGSRAGVDAWEVPKVIVMGSRMGSIWHNTQGNSTAGAAYAYRASKAGLNAIVRSFSVDVPEVVWTVVHPGRVETGLVRVKEDGAMSVEESVGDMVRLIGELGRGASGRFVDRFGVDIPW